METTIKNEAVHALSEQTILHTRLFKNVLLDINESDHTRKIADNTNHIAWLAGSMVSARFMMADLLGKKIEEPFPDLFKNNKAIQNNVNYPTLQEQLTYWNKISEILEELIVSANREELTEISETNFPVNDKSKFGAIIFHIDRESYVLGQLGLLRKGFGYPAMKYN
ncbi:MAG: DinB family protein [Saprospiraceae bacterium]|nr:DinB family protein [Saprospiraceae bacterium]